MRELRAEATIQDLQAKIAQNISDAVLAGCDRLVLQDNKNGYSTLLYALMPDELYTPLDGEYVIPVPGVDNA